MEGGARGEAVVIANFGRGGMLTCEDMRARKPAWLVG